MGPIPLSQSDPVSPQVYNGESDKLMSDTNEEAAYNAVNALLTESFARHPTTLAEDDAALGGPPISSGKRLLVTLRRQEKVLLADMQGELGRRWADMWAPDEPPPLRGAGALPAAPKAEL